MEGRNMNSSNEQSVMGDVEGMLIRLCGSSIYQMTNICAQNTVRHEEEMECVVRGLESHSSSLLATTEHSSSSGIDLGKIGNELKKDLSRILKSDGHLLSFIKDDMMDDFVKFRNDERAELIRQAKQCIAKRELVGETRETNQPFRFSGDRKEESGGGGLTISSLKVGRVFMDHRPFKDVKETRRRPHHHHHNLKIGHKSLLGAKDRNISVPQEMELTLKSDALILQPTSKDLDIQKKRIHIPLKSIEAVMDLAVCGSRALALPPLPDHEKNKQPKMTLKASIFRKSAHPKKKTLANKDNNNDDDDDDNNSTASTDDDDSDEDIYDSTSFRIISTADDESRICYTITCSNPLHRVMWLHAIHMILSNFLFDYYGQGQQDPGTLHKTMRTSLYSACVLGDSKMLHNILTRAKKSGMDVTDVVDPAGFSAIHYAVIFNNNRCLQILLDERSDPNIRSAKGLTPLDYAAEDENKRAVEMLVANGGKSTQWPAELPKKQVSTHENASSHTSQSEEASEQPHKKKVTRFDDAMFSRSNDASRDIVDRGATIENIKEKTDDLYRKSLAYKSMTSQLKAKAMGQRVRAVSVEQDVH